MPMIKSMTGYGKSEFTIGGDVYSIEVKSLNNRFMDMKVRLPERFYATENLVRRELKKRFARGSFNLFVNTVVSEAPTLRLNLPVVRAYLDAAGEIKEEFGVEGTLDAAFFMRLKEAFVPAGPAAADDRDWPAFKEGLAEAFDRLDEWRTAEGEALEADLLQRLSELSAYVSKVERMAPDVVINYREGLEKEMARLLDERVDEAKILHEAALFAQRSDIGEEIVRLKSHLEMFRGYLEASEPVGKRLDFLCQEILREANTIASKSGDLRMTQTIVEVKGVLEKMREQVQNVE